MIEDYLIPDKNIIDLINEIRGTPVMLDRDLARFYQVKATRLREQVKRNPKRFPSDFMFQLTIEEVDCMVSQNAIPSKQVLGGALPYAFTEQGVAALSSVLTSERAVDVSIIIIRSFVTLRKSVLNDQSFHARLHHLERSQIKTEAQLDKIFIALNHNKEIQQGIFYKGQIFDAYSFMSDIIRSANNSIMLIDNYIDDSVLTLMNKRKPRVKLKIITHTHSKQVHLDIRKYKEQYSSISVEFNQNFHDRFLILDHEKVYHIGASLKDIGRKCFAFSLLEKQTGSILIKHIDQSMSAITAR